MAQLAQANVFRPRAAWGDPVMREFVLALDPVNALAEDAVRRLRHLQRHGPEARAFGMRQRFEPDGRPSARRQGPRDRPPWRPADRGR